MNFLAFNLEETVANVGLWIVNGIYKVAAGAFKIFLILANGEIVSSDDYELLFNNCYVILGVVMLFIIAFSILKAIINPDDQKQGTAAMKKMIINLVTSAIMLAVLPTIFTFAFDFQKSILGSQNVIGRFFGFGSLGTNDDDSALNQVTRGANMIVNGVYTAFFNVNTDEMNCTITDNDSLYDCQKGVVSGSKNLAATITKVSENGSFGSYRSFAENVSNDEIDFNFFLSLIGGLILLYIGVSYCFDMGVRLIKLIFYQMIAPIPIMFRVIPDGKLSGTFNQWVKITLSCYLEVFIRIFVLYFCVYLCIKIDSSNFLAYNNWNYGFFTWLFTKAFIFMGIVTFIKQAPKLISDITGINSGNMKLGIKEKLAAGGAFTAGAAVGGGVTALTRSAISSGKLAVNKWGETKNLHGTAKAKAIGSALLATGGALGSTVSSGISGVVRSGKSGFGAKNWGDMSKAASSGAKAAGDARDKRAAYKASHGGTVKGTIIGHAQDAVNNLGEWAGIGVGDTNLGYYTGAAQSTSSFNDLSESTYKKKQEYIDQNSVVTALKSRHAAAMASGDVAEANRLKTQLDFETEALKNMQRTMAAKKKDVISIAATRLSVDQKTNYSGDEDFVNSYRKAIFDGFKVSEADYGRSRLEEVSVRLADGTTEKRNQRILVDQNGNDIIRMSVDETSILDAMLSGGEVKDEWINEDNVVHIQEAIDKANIGRQHIKTTKEREHIVRTGNRSTDKKNQ